MKHQVILEGKCYVLHSNYFHPILYNKYEMILYPERKLSLFERASGLIYEKSIITEDPLLICAYDRKDVFIWNGEDWVNPERQTLGCDFSYIMSDLLHINSSICMNIISHDKTKRVKQELDNLYKS